MGDLHVVGWHWSWAGIISPNRLEADRVTEGFDKTDLKEAKALLDELH